MLRFFLIAISLAVVGCEGGDAHPRSTLDQKMFGPAAIRIHPTFTQVRDWAGGGKPDGIEATLEVQDQLGEPTRSTGRVMFELHRYDDQSPQVRGRRVAGPWISYLNSKDQQQEHWNSALRAYTFQLHYPQIRTRDYYVLTAQFDLNQDRAATGSNHASTTAPAGRLFDQLILLPQSEEPGREHHARARSRTPGH